MKKFLMCLVVVAVVIALVKGRGEEDESAVSQSSDTSVETVTEVVETDRDNDVYTEEEGDTLSESTEDVVADNGTESVPEETEGIGDDIIDPAFKEAMDSYEAFFDEYVEFMNEFSNADTDEMFGLMGSYSEYMTQYAETMKKLDDINQEELNSAETLYYAEVSARISKKLLEVEY